MEAREVEEGCGGCKSMEEELYWKNLKCIRFCVAFRSDFHHKLQIPKKFAENMRPNFLNPKLTLRGPSGASWEVNLILSVDGFFLQHGWEEFVNAHTLQENDILFFKYDRNSTFNVKIFDGEYEKVAAYFVKKCGHVYPAAKNQKKRAINEVVGDEDNDNDDEIRIATKKSRKDAGTHRDGLRRCVRTSKKIQFRRNRIQFAINFVRKKAASRSSMEQQGRESQAETELAEQTEQNGQANKEVPAVDQNPPEVTENILAVAPLEKVTFPEPRVTPRRSLRSKSLVSISAETELVTPSPKIKASRATEYVSNRRPVTDQEKTEALAKAASELTDNSFFSAMQFYNCYKGFYMTIPARFASAHLGLGNQEVILRVGEKQWTTNFHFGKGRLDIGWKQFALDNYLEEYDACLFKLVSQENSESVKLDVTIFRVVDVINPPTLLTA